MAAAEAQGPEAGLEIVDRLPLEDAWRSSERPPVPLGSVDAVDPEEQP